MYLILAINIDFNGITLPCAIKTRNREQAFSSPPLSRVVRLAQGGEVDGRRLLKRANLNGLQ